MVIASNIPGTLRTMPLAISITINKADNIEYVNCWNPLKDL